MPFSPWGSPWGQKCGGKGVMVLLPCYKISRPMGSPGPWMLDWAPYPGVEGQIWGGGRHQALVPNLAHAGGSWQGWAPGPDPAGRQTPYHSSGPQGQTVYHHWSTFQTVSSGLEHPDWHSRWSSEFPGWVFDLFQKYILCDWAFKIIWNFNRLANISILLYGIN